MFGEYRKNQNGRRRPFCENMMKKLCTLWLIQQCIDQLHIWCRHWHTIEGGPYRFWHKSESKMAAGGHFEKKSAYWSEMARNAIKSNFRSSKMAAGGHFVNKIPKNKVAHWSEMAINAIKNYFWSSKMAAGSHFVKQIKRNSKSRIYLKWRECDRKWFSVFQNGRRRPFCKNKVAQWSEMAINAIKSDFRSSKMTAGGHFVIKKTQKIKLRTDLKWR